MLTECISIVRKRGAVAGVFALLSSAVPTAFAAQPDACIAGEYVIACQRESDLDDIGTFRGDSEAIRKAIFESIVAGKCKVFRDHDAVEVIDRTFVSDRRLVRRPGETASFWMPAKWTRPIAECGSAALAAKSTEPPRDASPPRPAATRQATSAQHVPEPSPPATCEIKPVMSDEDIATCHRARR